MHGVKILNRSFVTMPKSIFILRYQQVLYKIKSFLESRSIDLQIQETGLRFIF